MLELTIKTKKAFELHMDFKLKTYEDAVDIQKKELIQIKSELDSIKMKFSASQSFGPRK